MFRTTVLFAILLVTLGVDQALSETWFIPLVSPDPEGSGYFGCSVAWAGDVDNDGWDDVIVGTLREDWDGVEDAGTAHVFRGPEGELLRSLGSPNPEFEGGFGVVVSGAGDVDNDGHDDLVVGALYEDADFVDAGRAYVFSGATGDVLYPLASPNQQASGLFGGSVSGAGDVNNDGYDDVIVGGSRVDPWQGPLGESRAYVFSGETGDTLYTLVSPNSRPGYFGNSVAGLGDVDDDGCDDVVVGAWYEDTDYVDAGRAYVFSGATGDTLYTLVSPNQEVDGHFGVFVSGVGDVDNDGFPDVGVAALGEDPGISPDGVGRAYVFSGLTGDWLLTLVSPDPEAMGWFGVIAPAGYVDDDEHADLLVGAPGEEGGRAYVFSGATGCLLRVLESPSPVSGGFFGVSVSGGGSWSNDGSPCFAVGAWGEPVQGYGAAGKAYVFRPPTSAPDIGATIPSLLTLRGPFPNPTPGAEVRLCLRVLDDSPKQLRLGLYDVRGRCVATVLDRTLQSGENLNLTWRPSQRLRPGTYWWRLETGAQSVQRAMVIAK